MTILDYNRVVRGFERLQPGAIPGQAPGALLGRRVGSAGAARGVRRVRHVSRRPMVSAHDPPELIPGNDPIGRLPITLLTRHVIEPLLAIADPRIDKRIDFVGGGRGLAELERLVSSGNMAVAFALYPDADGRPDGGGRCRRHHAAEVDLVRAEACRRDGQPRAGLTDDRRRRQSKKKDDGAQSPSVLRHLSSVVATAGPAPRTASRHRRPPPAAAPTCGRPS